jgi:transposase InsO family protein
MNSQCQVDLIDMQSNPDCDMKFILVYQDHLTKFVLLRSPHSKRAYEVAYHLLDSFTTFGAPNILHSNNGREFCNQIIKSLCEMWNDIKIVHGKPRHSESQGSIEQANQDVENMLATWMETNNTTKWSEGLRLVQAMKNRAYREGTKCSPYEAMFGVPMKLGIANSVM